jgi:AcrR family transcriptional regulator
MTRLSRGSAPGAVQRTRKPAEVRRREILEAAAVEFAETGLAGTRLEVIAVRVGISHPRIVQMFGSKLTLFQHVVDLTFDRIEEVFRAAASGSDTSLVTLGDAYRRLLRRERTVGLMMLQGYAAAATPGVRELVARRHTALQRLVSKLTSANADQTRAFVATGLVLTVSTVLKLPGRGRDAAWGAWLLERVGESRSEEQLARG